MSANKFNEGLGSRMEMTPRKDRILSSVVRDYVRSGEPVGSKAIAEEIGVSSATVRNEMAELIELGLLEQPHTSAGRVPSQRGYREYVDRLMRPRSLSDEEKRHFDAALLPSAYDSERLLSSACELLSSVTRCAAVATTPSGASAKVKAIQFVQISRRTAMLLLMSTAGTMKTKVFRCDFDLTVEMLRMFFRVFNEIVTGRPVADITPAFLQTMGASMGELFVLAGPALRALMEAARDTMDAELIFSGQMNLLFYPELEHRVLMEMLVRKEPLAAMLSKRPGRVTAIIGGEAGRQEFRTASLLVSRYRVDGQDAGAFGLLGPIRMDYAAATGIMEYLTDRLDDLLSRLSREE